MATRNSHTQHDDPNGRGLGYEPRDANVPGLIKFAFWMAVVLAITMFGMKLTLNHFHKTDPVGPTASPLVTLSDRILPPRPQLQVQPHLELEDYCAVQERNVDSYAWIDQPSGIVRVPIDRAMDMVLTHGLPARSAAEAPPGAPAVPPIANPPEGADVQGQCGYLTENQPKAAGGEPAESK